MKEQNQFAKFQRSFDYTIVYSMEEPQEYKVVTIGEMGVGKTSIVNQFVSGMFRADHEPTVGAAYVKSSIEFPDKLVTLNIWDTAGQEKFHSLIPLYIRNAHACIITFSFDDDSSWKNIDDLYKSVQEFADPGIIMFLCGNKLDLTPNVNFREFEMIAESHNSQFFAVSAKTGQGIQLLFQKVAEACSRASNMSRPNETLESIIGNQDKKNACPC